MSTPSIVGVLPMGGLGSRLNLPFHKALAPTIVGTRIVPLYQHSIERLRAVTDDIRLVLSPEWRNDPCLRGLPGRRLWPVREGLSSAIAYAASRAPNSLIALALPDSVWWPADGFARLFLHLGNHDGILGLFRGSSLVLDEVVHDATGRVRDITRHNDPPAPDETITGWGCFLIRSEALRGLTDGLALSAQLRELDLTTLMLHGPYFDLGTPARYIAHHVIGA